MFTVVNANQAYMDGLFNVRENKQKAKSNDKKAGPPRAELDKAVDLLGKLELMSDKDLVNRILDEFERCRSVRGKVINPEWKKEKKRVSNWIDLGADQEDCKKKLVDLYKEEDNEFVEKMKEIRCVRKVDCGESWTYFKKTIKKLREKANSKDNSTSGTKGNREYDEYFGEKFGK